MKEQIIELIQHPKANNRQLGVMLANGNGFKDSEIIKLIPETKVDYYWGGDKVIWQVGRFVLRVKSVGMDGKEIVIAKDRKVINRALISYRDAPKTLKYFQKQFLKAILEA